MLENNPQTIENNHQCDELVRKFTKAIEETDPSLVDQISKQDTVHMMFVPRTGFDSLKVMWPKDEDENTRLKRELAEAREEIKDLKESKKSCAVLTKTDVVKKHVTGQGLYYVPYSELQVSQPEALSDTHLINMVTSAVLSMFPAYDYTVCVDYCDAANGVKVSVEQKPTAHVRPWRNPLINNS